MALSAGMFALWHGIVTTATLAFTNLWTDPLLLAAGLVGAFGAICAGGVLFAALRLWTGHLAGSFAAHAAFNVTLLLGLTFSAA